MHEAGIAESVIAVVQDALGERKARVLTVRVVIGALAGVDSESFTTWFEMLAKDTLADGAAVQVQRKPALLVCDSCGQKAEFNGWGPMEPLCAACSSPVRLEGGQEIFVDSVEIDT